MSETMLGNSEEEPKKTKKLISSAELTSQMKYIVQQRMDGTELISCKCSQDGLKETMYYAHKGEIGEHFRGVLDGHEYAIKSLVRYILNQ